jgi:hypothetical protein
MDDILFRGFKALGASKIAVAVHVSQNATTNMYIQSQVCYFSHRTTSFWCIWLMVGT